MALLLKGNEATKMMSNKKYVELLWAIKKEKCYMPKEF
jgi:hypothetical protein